MKKWTKVFLGTVCGISMLAGVACGGGGGEKTPEGYTKAETLNGKTTEQTYTEIMTMINDNKTNFTSNINYDVDCAISVKGYDGEMTMQMQMQVTDKIDGANLYEYAYIDMGEMMGEDMGEMKTTVWYIETATETGTTGTAYLDSTEAGKMKYTATWAQICEMAGMDSEEIFNPLYDFSDTSFDKVQFFVDENTEDENNVAPYFQLILAGDEAEAFANKQLSNVASLSDAKMKYSKIQYKFMLDENGAFDHAEVSFTVTMNATIEGMKTTTKYSLNGDIYLSDLGTTTVSAPANADSFYDYGNIEDYM